MSRRPQIYFRSLLLFSGALLGVMTLYAIYILLPTTACFSADGNPSALGLTFGYDAQTALHFFTTRNRIQLSCYREFIGLWDCLFPFVYAALFLFWFRFFYVKKFVLLFPVLLIAADLGENFLELSMMNEFKHTGTVSALHVFWGSFITQLKWTLAGFNVLLFAIGIFRRVNKHKS